MELWYNEGPRDWQIIFAITRFCFIVVLFSIVYCYWGYENRLLNWGLHYKIIGFFLRSLLNQGSTVLTTFLPKLILPNSIVEKWNFCYLIQSRLVLISGLGLNVQLFVLRLPCTFQGILHPPHLACLLIKDNKAVYQSTCIPRILKTNELSSLLGLLYASI